ncbi:MAG: hypothetical protein D6812_11880 [Deltaproteobacteria bacterium]|nr:MAG: hypothetical protein D6812_11880 [Deltaproteobacteria bacterium]
MSDSPFDKLEEARLHPSRVLEEQRPVKSDPAMEAKLQSKDWHAVVDAFAQTGDLKQIAATTNLRPAQVQYLLENGLQRLGLPPIRKKLVIEAQNKLAELSSADIDPKTRDAIESRQITEAKAAQQTLRLQEQVALILNRYLKTIMQGLHNGQIKLHVPEEVTPAFLEKLSAAASKNASAVSTAIKASRSAAGEASEAIKLQVEHLVALAKLPDDQIRRIYNDKDIPPHLRSLVPPTIIDDQ